MADIPSPKANIPSPEKYLGFDYQPHGQELRLKDDTEFYASGSAKGKKGVIIIPDTMGWNAGRIRNIADFFGDNGCYAVVPGMYGGKDKEQAPSYSESAGMGDYIKGMTFARIRPKIHNLVDFLRSEGVNKIAIIGFSYGGWVTTNILADDDLADKFVCGVLFHPSLNLEERVFGGDLVELMKRVNRPLLLVQTQSEPSKYVDLLETFKYKAPSSEVLDYSNIQGGFVLRGNSNDLTIKTALIYALQDGFDFIDHHYSMDVKDLVREAVKSTRKGSHQTQERARQFGDSAKQGAADTYNKLGERAQQAKEGTQQGWQDTKQNVRETYDKAGERAQQGWEQTKQGAQDTWEKSKEGVQEAGDRLQQGWEQTKQGARETYDKAADRTQQGWENTKEGTRQAGDRTQQGWEQTKEGAQDTSQWAGEKTHDAYTNAVEGIKNIGERIGETVKQAGEALKFRSTEQGHDEEHTSPKDKKDEQQRSPKK